MLCFRFKSWVNFESALIFTKRTVIISKKNKIGGTWFITNWKWFFRGGKIKEFIPFMDICVKLLTMWFFFVFKTGTLIIYLWWNFFRRIFLDIWQDSKCVCDSRYSLRQLKLCLFCLFTIGHFLNLLGYFLRCLITDYSHVYDN